MTQDELDARLMALEDALDAAVAAAEDAGELDVARALRGLLQDVFGF